MQQLGAWLEDCDLCGWNRGFVPLAVGLAEAEPMLAKLGLSGECKTVGCPRCGWVFKPRTLTASELDQLYAEEGGAATVAESALDASRQRSEQVYEALFEQTVQQALRVLDVGGGIGQVTTAFAARGHEVHILDLAGATPLDARMISRRGTLADLGDEHFDLIVMSHVLEHVWTPREFLSDAVKHLSKDGQLFVEVPFELYTPFVNRRLGDPRHVGYFAVHTLRAFLEQVGCEVTWIKRVLAPYNGRRVMALRALATLRPNAETAPSAPRAAQRFGKSGFGALGLGRLGFGVALGRTAAEMVFPQQVWHVLNRRRPLPA